MLNLYQKIQKIESLQAEADKETTAFKRRYGIDCLEHCSKCCQYNDITASPLEFLPLAWHYYKAGQLDELVEKLANSQGTRCVFSVSKDGCWGCCSYPARGMICRLFGFASIQDKHGKSSYAPCHSLKVYCPEKIQSICEKIHNGGRTPIIANFYRKLSVLDLGLGEEMLPINQAIKRACEIIYMHTAYK